MSKLHTDLLEVGLSPPDPHEQRPLPRERRADLLKLVEVLESNGVSSPQRVAALLDEISPQLRSYAQALWDMMALAGSVPRGTHDWKEIFDARDKPESIAPKHGPASDSSKAESRPFEMAAFPNAKGVLHEETLRMLQASFSRGTMAIIDGWAAENPRALKELEKSGELKARAKRVEDLETEAQQRAVEAHGQMPPLSSWEIAEVYGGANRTL